MHFSRAELYAHRGLSLNHTENTLESFAAAEQQGARWIETDVNTTSDGVVVIFHDPTLERVAGVRGRISEMTFEQVQAIDLPGGEKIPTLAQALEAFPALNFNIDIKDDASAAALPAVVVKAGAVDRVRIASFSEKRRRACLRGFEALVPGAEVLTSAAMGGTTIFALAACYAPPAWPFLSRVFSRWVKPFDSLQIPEFQTILGRDIRLAKPKMVAAARRHGKQIHVWTVDEPEKMNSLLELGIDGIVTNRSDIFSELFGRVSA